MSNKVNLNAQNLQQVLGETSQQKLVLLNFFSPQSPECISQAAILDKLAAEYNNYIVVANLDCDAEQAFAPGEQGQRLFQVRHVSIQKPIPHFRVLPRISPP